MNFLEGREEEIHFLPRDNSGVSTEEAKSWKVKR